MKNWNMRNQKTNEVAKERERKINIKMYRNGCQPMLIDWHLFINKLRLWPAILYILYFLIHSMAWKFFCFFLSQNHLSISKMFDRHRHLKLIVYGIRKEPCLLLLLMCVCVRIYTSTHLYNLNPSLGYRKYNDVGIFLYIIYKTYMCMCGFL